MRSLIWPGDEMRRRRQARAGKVRLSRWEQGSKRHGRIARRCCSPAFRG